MINIGKTWFISDPNNIHLYRALTDEVKIMCHIEPHVNVLRFIGACTENIKNKQLFVMTEFCELGSLREFLIKNFMKFEGFDVNAYGQYKVRVILNYNTEKC